MSTISQLPVDVNARVQGPVFIIHVMTAGPKTQDLTDHEEQANGAPREDAKVQP